ncbi:MAG: transcription initiation factor IIB [Nitrosopumilus sp.]|nr:transcription initiation factor IIB [Nitrosopumilus sp.]MDH3735946.1 transcription initiation factor IIB [Nitrosopumilus sp.]MDH3823633.1 transcription initiation factor IIB [Nitrosopumilus sp.]MDH3833842.1 transcription initiation factor IIB [Nitrosopumilus sp.]
MTILQKIEETELICNNCNKSRFITDDVTGEIACSSCGCVLSGNTEDRGAERRIFSDKSDSTRTGPGLSLKMHDRGLNTVIGTLNQDSVGKPLSTHTAQIFGRLRKWDSRSQTKSSADRSLRNALQELGKVQSKLGLSDTVIERASLFYRKASEKNLVRGRTVKGMAAACLYASCRDLGHTRTLTEIAEQVQIQRKDIARSYRSLFRELGFAVSIADPIKSISKIASKIGITEKTVRKAVHIVDTAQDAGIVAGKNPEIIAAAAIYAACVITGETKSQVEIALASGTSTVSIRNRILDFKTKLGLFSTVN